MNRIALAILLLPVAALGLALAGGCAGTGSEPTPSLEATAEAVNEDATAARETEEALAALHRELYDVDFAVDESTMWMRTGVGPADSRLAARRSTIANEGGVLWLGIDYETGRIAIGVTGEEHIPGVESILDQHGIPQEDVRFEIVHLINCCERPEGYPEYTLP